VPLETTRSGDLFQLRDPTRGNISTFDAQNQDCFPVQCARKAPVVLFTDADNHWGDGTTSDRATVAVDAQYDSAVTWDFYRALGRNGIDGSGRAWSNHVHAGAGVPGVSWGDGCLCVMYGDGDNTRYGPFTTLDMTAHAVAHGVTAYTSGLGHGGEPGALNEATSDIMAAAVEFYANNPADVADYLIGEKTVLGSAAPIRSMDRPSRDGRSPDAWSPDVGRLEPGIASGVGDHFFYLLAEGSGAKDVNGVHYDSPTSNGTTITGIGVGPATKIWYAAATGYMRYNTNYKEARRATLEAAGNLFGKGGVEQATVAAAWSAVNVN
jgi:Zn-dependent metalloprotease